MDKKVSNNEDNMIDSIDVYAKIHGIEQLSPGKISVDIEVVALRNNQTVPDHTIELKMNLKSHRLATMENGKLRSELIFPIDSRGRQTLTVQSPAALSQSAAWSIEILPPNAPLESITPPGKPSPSSLIKKVSTGSRPIERNEIITLPKGFYDVADDIHIQRGGTLIIEAGTILEFASNAGIICEGVIQAMGTEANRIVFTSGNGSWRNILIYGRHTAGSILTHCLIENGIGRNLSSDDERQLFLAVNDDSATGKGMGGGMQLFYTQNAEITLKHLVLRDNTAVNGGGLYLLDSSPSIENSEIIDNKASYDGGGIYIAGKSAMDAEFKYTVIKGNHAGNDGGGVYLDTVSPGFFHVEVIQNVAHFGSGIYHNNVKPDALRLDNCRIIANESTADTENGVDICGNWV